MVIDHIIPLAAGGTSARSNLCLACYRCNEFKGARTTGIDPLSGVSIPIFHPRTQAWYDHFEWNKAGLLIVPKTVCGQVTIALLHLNDEWLVRARGIWILAGIHPPLE